MQNLINIVDRVVSNYEQARDRRVLSDTATHRAAGEAALEILNRQLAFERGERRDRVSGQEIASVIYENIRKQKEL